MEQRLDSLQAQIDRINEYLVSIRSSYFPGMFGIDTHTIISRFPNNNHDIDPPFESNPPSNVKPSTSVLCPSTFGIIYVCASNHSSTIPLNPSSALHFPLLLRPCHHHRLPHRQHSSHRNLAPRITSSRPYQLSRLSSRRLLRQLGHLRAEILSSANPRAQTHTFTLRLC